MVIDVVHRHTPLDLPRQKPFCRGSTPRSALVLEWRGDGVRMLFGFVSSRRRFFGRRWRRPWWVFDVDGVRALGQRTSHGGVRVSQYFTVLSHDAVRALSPAPRRRLDGLVVRSDWVCCRGEVQICRLIAPCEHARPSLPTPRSAQARVRRRSFRHLPAVPLHVQHRTLLSHEPARWLAPAPGARNHRRGLRHLASRGRGEEQKMKRRGNDMRGERGGAEEAQKRESVGYGYAGLLPVRS